MGSDHRIIDDRIEKSIKGRRIRHNLPWRVLRPPHSPCPAGRGEYGWSEGAPDGVGDEDDVEFILFHFVIYNSLCLPFGLKTGVCSENSPEIYQEYQEEENVGLKLNSPTFSRPFTFYYTYNF